MNVYVVGNVARKQSNKNVELTEIKKDSIRGDEYLQGCKNDVSLCVMDGNDYIFVHF